MMPGNTVGTMQAFKNFRSYFFRGMAALLPTILTIWIFVQCYIFIQDKVSIHINRGLVRLILLITDNWEEEFLIGFWVNGPGRITGFFVAIIGVCFIGAFLASVMGRTLWHFMEKNLMRVPLVSKVYPYIKQVTDFFLAKKSLEFSKVVAFEYPRKDTWSVGLVTGTGLKRVASEIRKDFFTVFVFCPDIAHAVYGICHHGAEGRNDRVGNVNRGSASFCYQCRCYNAGGAPSFRGIQKRTRRRNEIIN
ncbi:MAG: DUF502 domain-containing protein [Planctomycetota bacterium]|jgi:uncharacterized membrane protein